jgi:hypothetical protein
MLETRDISQPVRDPLSLRAVSLAGTFAALSAAFLICRVPAASPGTLSAPDLLRIACKYVLSTAATGMAATWVYFRYSTMQAAPVLRTLARSLSLAWLLFPAFVLFLWEDSPGLLFAAPAAAAALALSLERFLPIPPEPEASGELFAGPPPLPPRQYAVFASIAIYAAAIAAVNSAITTASLSLALATFLVTARWSASTRIAPPTEATSRLQPARLAGSLLLAFLLTLIALLPWLRTAAHLPLGAIPNAAVHARPRPGSQVIDPADAWHAIVLWPYPPRQNQLPPIPRTISYHPGTASTPLIILFNGSYRYFQTPGEWIAARAHSSHSSPLAVDIHSADWGPLFEEAHQPLTAPVDLACCRAIQVEVRNSDNRRGGIVLGVILSDSTQNTPHPARKPDPFAPNPGYPVQSTTAHSLALTPQPVLSSFPAAFTMKSSPVNETLTFVIPSQPRLRRFDEISVVFLPEPQRAAVGAKIAIQQFALIQR